MDTEELFDETGDDWPELHPGEVDGRLRGLTRRRARLWALVLEARSVPFRLAREHRCWVLRVPSCHLDQARNELFRFERENRGWPPVDPVHPPPMGMLLPTLSVLLLLATFYNLTRLDLLPVGLPGWNAMGNADAGKILSGEWWRTVTALTLHADWVHLTGNIAIGGLFIAAVCREFGSGLGWCLLLGTGAAGNLANAWFHPPTHASIGASTLVFGAVGILAAVSSSRRRYGKRLVAVAAALALLADLGTAGENVDLGAHLFGFFFGFGFGMIAESGAARFGRPGKRLNGLLAAAAALIVGTAWLAALAAGG